MASPKLVNLEMTISASWYEDMFSLAITKTTYLFRDLYCTIRVRMTSLWDMHPLKLPLIISGSLSGKICERIYWFQKKRIKLIMMMEMVCWGTYFPRAEWKKVCVCQRCISAIFKCGPTHPWLQTAPLGPGATLSYAPALSPFFRRNKCGHFFSKQQRKLPNDVT